MRDLLLILALLCAGSAAAAGAEPKERTFRIVYEPAFSSNLSLDLLLPIEMLLRSDPERVRLEKVEMEKVFYRGNDFLFRLPTGVRRSDLPAAGAPVKELAELPVLETASCLLFIAPPADASLLDRLLAFALERDSALFGSPARLPDARKGSGKLLELGDALRAISIGQTRPGAAWTQSAAFHYHLTVDGRPTVVTVMGKPLGGARVKPALDKRLAELRDPFVLLGLGALSSDESFGLPKDGLLKPMLDSGFRTFVLHPDDILAGMPVGQGINRLCSNLKWNGPGVAPPVERSHIEEVQGVRVGFFSVVPTRINAGLLARRVPWEAQDPVASAREAVEELRNRLHADIVVGVSELAPEETSRLVREVPEIDILLDGAGSTGETVARRRTLVELEGWSLDRPRSPALVAEPRSFTFGELSLTVRPVGQGWELVRAAHESGPIGHDLPLDPSLAEYEERLYAFFISPQEAVLPDPRALWPEVKPPRLFYRPTDFWNLAAGILRETRRTEISFLQVRTLGSNIPGEYPESFVAEWMSPDRSVAAFQLPGSALRGLLNRVSRDPVDMPYSLSQMKYLKGGWLAAAGVDAKGRVGGLPLRDDELYSVSATDDLLKDSQAFPEFQQALKPVLSQRTLSPAVLEWLKTRKRRAWAGYLEEMASRCEGKTPPRPIWRIHLRDLSFQFADTQVRNNDSFPEVRDARIQTIDQILVQGSARLFSELYWGRLRWDVGTSADYGKLTLKPRGVAPIKNETADQLLVETELRHRSLRWERGSFGWSAGPFLNVAYDTEFTRPLNTPFRRYFRVKPGLKLFEGSLLSELYVSAVSETDYSTPRPNTEYGLSAGLELAVPVPRTRGALLRGKAGYLRFAPSRSDTPDDLRSQLYLNGRFSVPIVGSLMLSPFVDYYRFDGKVVHEAGHNMLFGVALDYSFLWKPLF